jgi:hypothetical protein
LIWTECCVQEGSTNEYNSAPIAWSLRRRGICFVFRTSQQQYESGAAAEVKFRVLSLRVKFESLALIIVVPCNDLVEGIILRAVTIFIVKI